jgi:hypothetical protein
VTKRPELGEALQRAMSARGRDLQIADARRLALALLGLAEADLLVPAEDADSGRPHVYNMGPSRYEAGKAEPC